MRDTTIDKRPERKSKTAAQALQALMRLCSRAEKSSGDAMRLMHTWDVPEGERRGVLDKLIELRFIDDTRYAEAYTREKSQLAGWGAKKIALHLRQKGIDKEIITRTLSALDNSEQQERLEDKLQKKLRTTKANNRYELRGKLLRYAMSLGYEYDSAKDIIDKITTEE
jgi:regulatory protein